MKKIYFLMIFLLFSIQIPAQFISENKDLMSKEMGRYQRMIDFNINPNTLNYDLKYQRMEVFLDPEVFQISGTKFYEPGNNSTENKIREELKRKWKDKY